MREVDVIIVGGGVAGISASIPLLRESKSVLLIEKRFLGGKLNEITEISNYPSYSTVSGIELSDRFIDSFNALSGELLNALVTKITQEKSFFIVEADGINYKCKYLVIASGSKYKTLGLPKEEDFIGKGISLCALCDGPLYRNKVVATVGGSLSAIKEAIHLASLVSKLYFIHRNDATLKRTVELTKLRQHPNVEFIIPATIKELRGEDALSSLVLDNGRELFVEALFEFVGYEDNLEFLTFDVKKDQKGFILVNQVMESSVLNLFVIGDAKSFPQKQVSIAASDGIIVGNEIIERIADGE